MPNRAYEDFKISFQRSGRHRYFAIADARNCSASDTFNLDLTVEDLENLDSQVSSANECEALQDLGERLYRAVFQGTDGGIGAGFLQCLTDIHNQPGKKGLRIQLRFSGAPELASLPWESLYQPNNGRFLTLSPATPVTRFVEGAWTGATLSVAPPLRVLVVIANGAKEPRLDVKKEWQKLESAFDELDREGLVLLEPLEKATMTELLSKVTTGEHHIFHFIGHGGFDEEGANCIFLEGEDGSSHPVTGEALGSALHGHSFRLVTINSCLGGSGGFESVAEEVAKQGIPAVVGMQFSISDDAAVRFATMFYHGIAGGQSVEEALTTARLAIKNKSPKDDWGESEWVTPVLYMRKSEVMIFNLEQLTRDQRNKIRRDALISKAQTHFDTGRFDEADDVLSKLLDGDADNEDVKALRHKLRNRNRRSELYQLGIAAQNDGKLEEAVEHFHALCEIDRSYKDADERLQEAQHRLEERGREETFLRLLSEAQEATECWEWSKAESRLRDATLNAKDQGNEALKAAAINLENARNCHSVYVRGQKQLAEGKPQQAIESFKTVRELRPHFGKLEELLAQAQSLQFDRLVAEANRAQREKNWGVALAKYKEAMDLNPDAGLVNETSRVQKEIDFQVACKEGEEALARRNGAIAVAKYAVACQLKPENRNAHRKLKEAREMAEALEIEKKYLELISTAEAAKASSDWQSVIDNLKKAQDLKPSSDLENQIGEAMAQQDCLRDFELGKGALEKKDWRVAVEAFIAVAKRCPDFPGVKRFLDLAKGGQRKELCASACKIAKEYIRAKRLSAACRALKRALQADPTNPEANLLFHDTRRRLNSKRSRFVRRALMIVLGVPLVAAAIGWAYLGHLYRTGVANLSSGQPALALENLRLLNRIAPFYGNVHALVRMAEGVSLELSGQSENALEKYQQAQQLGLDSPELKVRLDKLQSQRKRMYQEAMSAFEAQKWEESKRLFENLKGEFPNYLDTNDKIRETAEKSERAKTEAEFNDLIRRAVAAEKRGRWDEAETQYLAAKDKSSDFTSYNNKLERARTLKQFMLGNDSKVLFFSACTNDDAVKQIAKTWTQLFPGNLSQEPVLPYSATWKNQWKMIASRIYYITDSVMSVAEGIASKMPGQNLVVNYQNQASTSSRLADAPPDHDPKMVGLESRAIVFFIGQNYEAIRLWLAALAEGRQLTPEEQTTIKQIEEQQTAAWAEASRKLIRAIVHLQALSSLSDGAEASIEIDDSRDARISQVQSIPDTSSKLKNGGDWSLEFNRPILPSDWAGTKVRLGNGGSVSVDFEVSVEVEDLSKVKRKVLIRAHESVDAHEEDYIKLGSLDGSSE